MGVPVPRGVMAACLILLTALLGAPPASADIPSLPVAQERLTRADLRLDRLDRQLARLQARQRAVHERSAAARTQVIDASRRFRAAVADTAKTAARARRATIDRNSADQRAGQTRAAVQRMARTAYMHSSTGGELAVMIGVAVGGPQSLAGYTAGDLAVDRVQSRVFAEAQDAATAAQAAAGVYTDATTVYTAAMHHLGTARTTLAAARSELGAATADTRSVHRALVRVERERAGAASAVASARTALVKARRAAARRAAQAPTTLPTAPDIPATSGNQAVVVWQILRANGFTKEAAAGILGNLQQESNIDPTAVQFDGPGMGLAQWSRGGRWDTGPNCLLAYAAAAGLDPWDARTQTRFMIVEMAAAWGGFDLEAYKRRTDVVAAAVYFHDVYEVSADTPEQVVTVRGGYALQWYAALAG